jgi:hypothetical protein
MVTGRKEAGRPPDPPSKSPVLDTDEEEEEGDVELVRS